MISGFAYGAEVNRCKSSNFDKPWHKVMLQNSNFDSADLSGNRELESPTEQAIVIY